LKMVRLELRNLRVTEESSKVFKVGQGGDLTMTAESRRRKANHMCMMGRCNVRMADEEEARGSSIAKFRRGSSSSSRRSNPGFS